MAKVTVEFRQKRILDKVKAGNVRSIFSASNLIRRLAMASILFRRNRLKSSPEGSPPFTHGRRRLPKSILFAVNQAKNSSIIGVDSTKFGMAGGALEHGGTFMGEQFDKRPFMVPALEKVKPRLPRMWANSVST